MNIWWELCYPVRLVEEAKVKTELLKCGNATVGPATVGSWIRNQLEADGEVVVGLN